VGLSFCNSWRNHKCEHWKDRKTAAARNMLACLDIMFSFDKKLLGS
jgi:hypothetical protein